VLRLCLRIEYYQQVLGPSGSVVAYGYALNGGDAERGRVLFRRSDGGAVISSMAALLSLSDLRDIVAYLTSLK
jgi:hypothetical protein